MASHQLTTTAVVLRRTSYQEADRILTVLSKEYGKLSLIAKGARRAKSKLAGGIELFALNELSYIKGKSDLHTLTSSRVSKQFSHIAKDIDRTMLGYEFLKIIDKIVAENADDSDYFDVLSGGLSGLDDTKLDMRMSGMWFFLHALDQSGLSPDVRRDTHDEALDEDLRYEFDAQDMRFAKHDSGALNAQHIKLFRLALASSSVKKLSNIYVEPDIIQNCYSLSKRMVEHNLL